MKEKTFKDLGLDEGDKYLKNLSLEYDLGNLSSLIDGEEDDKKLLEEKIKEIKNKI